MSQMMRAVEISAPGGPDVLRLTERPRPAAAHGQVVIRVAWAGVNRPDALQRAGAYAPPPGASDLPGLECAGHVAEVGPGVTAWREGDACAEKVEPSQATDLFSKAFCAYCANLKQKH